MAPQQRTFTIVPNPLGMQGLVQRPAGEGVPASHRPMTSKQAQKLHRQNTKLPKRTKAEQAKWEAEQKRLIKEEDEKRRASNKARILRDKKKEREQKIIEAKKRKGLPIVDVRPSQDLITRFVRGNGTGKKRGVDAAALDTVREESPACDSAVDEDVCRPEEVDSMEDMVAEDATDSREPSPNPTKRLRTDTVEPAISSAPATQSPRQSQRASRTAVSALKTMAALSRESSLDVDDPMVEDLLRTQILEDSISAANSSAVEQRSPAQLVNTSSQRRSPPGKENVPPVSVAAVTSLQNAQASPPKAALQQPHTQTKSPPRSAVPSPRVASGWSETGVAPDSQFSQMSVASTMAPAKQPCQETSRTPTLRLPDARLRTRPSSYQADLIEDITSGGCTPGKARAGRPSSAEKHPNPCCSRPLAGSPARSATRNPRFETQAKPKPLQESNANIHRLPGNNHKVYAVVRPAPAVKPAPKAPPSVSRQSMPPPPPPSSRFKRPSQDSTRPKFLPKHLQTPVPRPPSALPGLAPASVTAESAPPSSTQLFVLSHLDDILPSPSQELRELEEVGPRQPPITKPKPPPFKPPPRYATRPPIYRPTPPARPQFKPAPPKQPTTAIAPVRPMQQTIEPALPFFSTQDFMLSSQDIRDLEDTTETPSKLPAKDAPGKMFKSTAIPTCQETPSKAEVHPPRAGAAQRMFQKLTANIPAQRPQFSQASRYSLRKSQPRTPVCSSDLSGRDSQPSKAPSQGRCVDPVRSNTALCHVAADSQRSLRSSPLSQTSVAGDRDPASDKPSPARETTLAQESRPSPVTNTEQQSAADKPSPNPRQQRQAEDRTSPKPAAPKSSASPKKARFFTASNEAIQLAMEKSRRTHKEEQRKREAEQRALELLRRLEEEEVQQRKRAALERRQREEADEALWDADFSGQDALLLAGEKEQPERGSNDGDSTSVPEGAEDGTLGEEGLGSFDLAPELEQELLEAEFEVDVKKPSPVGEEGGGQRRSHEEKMVWIASQETDYGDLDVTVEELDEYL